MGLAAPIIGSLIGAGGQIAGDAIASGQASKATNAQLAAGQQGIGAVTNANQQANKVFSNTSLQQQQMLSPYTALGTGALDTLQNKLGITPPGMVRVKNSATGLVHTIPQSQVGAAQAAGGVLV